MFRAQPLTHTTLWLLASEAPDVALLLAQHGVFAPAPDMAVAVNESPAAMYREVFLEADSRLAKLLEHCGGETPMPPEDAVAPSQTELQDLNAVLKTVWQSCSALHEAEARNAEAQQQLNAQQDLHARLHPLGLDLSQLFRADSLLRIRLGQVPAANVPRLRDALALAGYVMSVFETPVVTADKTQKSRMALAVLAGPRGQDAIGGVLNQAGWHDLAVPETLQQDPEAARAFLAQEKLRLESERAELASSKRAQLAGYAEALQQARISLALARPLAQAAQDGVRGQGQLAVFTGWVPTRELATLRAALAARFHGRYWLTLREPRHDECRQVPSRLHYPFWLRPFVPLVQGYGVPRYGEFDPALLFMLAYLLLFGAMFGDIGHGAVIMLVSAWLLPKLGRTAWIGIAAGLVSMGFGWVYGSVFGYETWVQPLWISPLHDPIQVLGVAIWFGLGFIALTLLANIYNTLHRGDTAKALCDAGGLAGLVFYLGATAVLLDYAGQTHFGAAALWVAAAALATLAAYKWLETPASLGERLAVTVIETLETAVNLFANTLSFMRVAAFSLNHVALALAVFTLVQGLHGAGHGFAVVLGNAIIIVLEGGIVAIQALRLMYFEGFSRFFSADGVAFAPLKVVGR